MNEKYNRNAVSKQDGLLEAGDQNTSKGVDAFELLEGSAVESAYETETLPSTGLADAIKTTANHKKNMLVLNRNLDVVYISRAVQNLFYGYHHIEKKPFFNVFGNILRGQELTAFLHHIHSPDHGFSWSGFLTHTVRTKKNLYTHMNVTALFDPERQLSGYLIIFEDVTEANEARDRNMLLGLLEASKLKDDDTGRHNERLNHYARVLAQELYARQVFPQIDAEFIEKLSFFAALHDIGKIGVPDGILQKKGPLSEAEWKIMREHTINGAYILAFYPERMAKEIALSHHERWDGTGYPYNLIGEMIPLAARIVAVADVYDALRMKRSYKPAYDHETASRHIVANSGTHFDPAIVEVFRQSHSKFAAICKRLSDSDEEQMTQAV